MKKSILIVSSSIAIGYIILHFFVFLGEPFTFGTSLTPWCPDQRNLINGCFTYGLYILFCLIVIASFAFIALGNYWFSRKKNR